MMKPTHNRTWMFLAAAGLLMLSACHEMIDNTPADFQTLKETRPIGTARQLEVRLRYDVGSLEIRSDKGENLFALNLDYDANRSTPKFDFRENGDRASLELSMDERMKIHSNKRSNDLSLRLNDAVPMNLDLAAGVSDSHLDLTDLDIDRLHIRGGVGRTEVAFDKPVEKAVSYFEVESGVGHLTIRGLGNARVARLKVEGGVGRTDLDFTGDLKDSRIEAEIEVGVGQVHLQLPREVGITIDAEGSFLSNISAPGFEKNGRSYTHSPEGSSTRIVIRVRSGVGGVKVQLI
jgi:hypothetical protein